ncbi:MAG: hypothetical protein HQL03_05890 [Nitrospirae bacterium]|nr:hypothetical protein [Nitrospirota bacterium]
MKTSRLITSILLVYLATYPFGCVRIPMTEETLLQDKPIADVDVKKTMGLYRQEMPLSSDTRSPISILEGKVTIDKADILYLPKDETDASVDRTRNDMYLVKVPFTLNYLSDNRYYRQFAIHFSLADSSAVAYDLFPQEVVDRQTVTEKLVISPSLKFRKDIEGRLGEYIHEVKYERLIPRIEVFKVKENEFYWLYRSQDTQELFQGTNCVFMILKVPIYAESVRMKVYNEAVISRKYLGVFTLDDLKSDEGTIYLDLEGAKRNSQKR